MLAGTVVDLEPELDLRQVSAALARVGAKLAWKMTALRVGVVEQIDELLFNVSIVHVERCTARLEGA